MKKRLYFLSIPIVVLLLFMGNSVIVIPTLVEKINLKLTEDETAIVFITDKYNDLFLITNNTHSLLLLLNYKGTDLKSILNKFSIKDVVTLTIEDIHLNNEYGKIVVLKNEYTYGEVEYKLDKNLIKISYEDMDFCIYVDRGEKRTNFMACNFIYFYNVNNIGYFDINERTEIIFYHNRRPLSTYLVEDIYQKWINTYTIRDGEYTIIKLNDDYYNIIVVPNI
jgi:hypothetical protein